MADVAQQTHQVGMAPILPSERGLSFFDILVLWADLGISFLVVAADRLGYLRGHYYGAGSTYAERAVFRRQLAAASGTAAV
jgi:hypothetical protein